MPTNEYHCIGRGGCGSVWALPITSTTTTTLSDNEARALQLPQILQRPHVLKRADGDTERSVANDMAMHRRFLHSTGSVHLPFLVPHSYRILQAHDREYPDNLPAGRTPCESYLQERIPPLPLSIRSTLIITIALQASGIACATARMTRTVSFVCTAASAAARTIRHDINRSSHCATMGSTLTRWKIWVSISTARWSASEGVGQLLLGCAYRC
jgi:hypothetical protein